MGRIAAAAWIGVYGLKAGSAGAVDIVSFSSSDVGSTHAVGEWGTDFGNLQIDSATMGSSLTSYGTDFDMSQPLNANGTLSTTAMSEINSQAATMAASGLKLSVFMGPTVGNTDGSYEYATYGNVNVTQWAAAVTAYKNYWVSLGYKVSDITPFNEPDYWSGQGSAAQLAQIIQLLRDDPSFAGIKLQGGATLNAANAQTWYNSLVGMTDYGSSHLLGGSLSNYDTFAQSVTAGGVPFAAPELHSLGEAIVTANYNASEAGWWLDPLLARGTFSQASSGKRLGYSVNFNQETAAAVYRAPNGSTYAFAGGLERSGGPDTYQFVSSDRPMYVNGIGPISSYTMQADSDVDTAVTSNSSGSFGSYFDQGAMAKIDYGAPSVPALDGYRWQIQNVQTGQLLSVAGGATGNNALINTATGTGSTSQMWDITRIQDGYLTFINDNSGRVVAVNGATQAVGGSVIQYDSVSSLDQQWDLVSAGNGAFYIQDGNSGYYLTGSSSNDTQQPLANGTAAAGQQWRFIAVNPTRAAKASYTFNGNANDSTGNFNAAVTGTAAYTAGPTAGSHALVFDGSSTYVTLPNAVSNTSAGIIANYSSGMTVDAWVKWNGGNAWQRIFDFGTGTNAYLFLTPSSGAGTLRFGITSAGNGEEEDVDTNPLPTGQWVNVAVTLGGHSAIIYENGLPVAAGSVLINPAWVNATNDFIGKSQFPADPLFNGSIGSFQVFDYALNQTQIDNLLNNNLTWVGSQNGSVWDAGTTANFFLNGSSSVFTQGDRVTFDGTGTNSVNLSGVLSPFSVTVSSNASVTFAGTGVIAGSTALTKTGTGTLTINTSNTFTGGTAISNGTVVMGNATALGTGGIDLVTGGTLTTTNYSGGSPTISNTIFGDGGTVTAASGTTLTLAGNLAGSGALTLTAADSTAALRLTGNNSSFAGNAIVNGINVRLASANAGSGSATWTINTTLQLDEAGATTYPLGALAGSGVIGGHATNATSTTSTLVVGGAGSTSLFSGQIVNNVSGGTNNIVGVTIAGGGTQILSGSNTYTGPTLISSGTLMLGNGGTTGSIPLASTLTDNGTLAFNHSNSLTEGVNFNLIAGAGALLQAGTGTLLLNAGNNFSGGTTVTAGVVSISDDSFIGTNGSPITLNGGTLATTAYVYDTHPFTIGTNGGTINVQTTGQCFFNIFNLLRGNGPLTLTGNGTLTANTGNLRLNQGNTFSGAVLLQQGGILEYGQNGAISSAAAVTIANQGELAVQGGFAVTEPSAVTVTGSTNAVLSFENGTAGTVTGSVTINGSLTVGLRDWYNYAAVRGGTISGVISGTGSMTVNSGSGVGGTLMLSGASTFTGNVIVNASTVDAAYGANIFSPSNGALGDPAVAGRTVTINSNGTVAFTTGNVLGSGGQSEPPALSFVVNPGGTLAAAVGTNAGGGGGGDANLFGNITLNGGAFTAGNGYNAAYQAAIFLGTVTVAGTSASTITTNATNTTANGIMLGAAGGVTFNVGRTGLSGADLTVSAPLVDSNSGSAGSLIKTGAGTMLLTAADTFTGGVIVNAGTLVLASAGAFPAGTAMTVAGAGTVQVANHGGNPAYVPIVSSLSNNGTIDLLNNAMVIQNGSIGVINAQVAAGYNNGSWSGTGGGVITSSLAAVDPNRLTAIGLATGIASFENRGVFPTSVLLKETYYGDTNLDGKVDGSDYSRLDNGFLKKLTGWFNGDFNYDGVIDGSDYTLIDNAFNTQGAALADQIGGGVIRSTAQIAQMSAVPEPLMSGMIGSVMAVALSLRRNAGYPNRASGI